MWMPPYRFHISMVTLYYTIIHIGAKLAVAPVARATPLFLPRPEIIYINVLHFCAPPRTYLVSATPLFRPLWRHCTYTIILCAYAQQKETSCSSFYLRSNPIRDRKAYDMKYHNMFCHFYIFR